MTKRILLLLLTLAMLLTVSCNKLDTPTTGTSGTTDTTPNTSSGEMIVQYCQMNGLEEYIEESEQLKKSGLYPNFFVSAEQLIKIGNFKSATTDLPYYAEAGKDRSIRYYFRADPTDEKDHPTHLYFEIHEPNASQIEGKNLLDNARSNEESEFFKIVEDSTTCEINPILTEFEDYGHYQYYLKDCDALIHTYYYERHLDHFYHQVIKCHHIFWEVGDFFCSIEFSFYVESETFENEPIEPDSFDELPDWLKEFTYINNVKSMIEEINQSILSEAQ